MTEPAPHRLVLPKLTVPPKTPEPFVKQVRFSFEAADGEGRGAGYQVHCGGCCHRAFDVYEEMAWRRVGYDGGAWFPTGRATVERRCPRCHSLETCKVTLEPGRPFVDGLDGPWLCSHCGDSLGRIDRMHGKVKASCRKGSCREKVTASAKNVINDTYRSVDVEKARRLSAWLESA